MVTSFFRKPVPTVTRGALRGIVEIYEDGGVFGWVADDARPEAPISLDIYVDGTLRETIAADRPRPDLAAIGGQGFGYLLYQEAAEKPRTVEIFRAGTREAVRNSPLTEEGRWDDVHRRWKRKIAAASIVGREGWLYLCNDTNGSMEQFRGQMRFGREQLEKWGEVLEKRTAFYRERGIPYVFAVAPGKESIYPEYLPEGITPSPRGTTLDQLVAAAGERPDATLFDLRPVLMAAKDEHPLYYKQDTHWNFVGAYHAYRALFVAMRRLTPRLGEPLPPDAFLLEHTRFTTGDLTGKELMQVGQGGYEPLTSPFALPPEDAPSLRPLSPRRARRVPVPPHLQPENSRQTVVMETGDASLPTAVMFRDSNADWLLDYFAEHFRRIVFVWISRTDPAIVEAEKPDMVFQVMAERFIIAEPEV